MWLRKLSKFKLWSLFVILTVACAVLAVAHEYILVQRRKEFWPKFNDHSFSVRAAAVWRASATHISYYPEAEIPWIRRLMGDTPVGHLIYDPNADPDGSQLHRTRRLFPEAKIWGWRNTKLLPDGIERLTEQHYVMI